MSISKKCPQCGTWNGDVDYCAKCNHLFSFAILRELEEKKRSSEEKDERNFFERYLDQLRPARNPIVKLWYYALNSIYLVIYLAISLILAIVALGPG